MNVSSEKLLLKELGNLRAIKKISAIKDAPRKEARNISLKNPVSLLKKEKIEYDNAGRASLLFFIVQICL